MDIGEGARVFGVLVTSSIALWLIALELRNAEWRSRFRRIMDDLPEVSPRRPNPWKVYLQRIKSHFRVLDKPFEVYKVTFHLAMMFVAMFTVTMLLHYFFVIGLVISLTVSLFLYDRLWSGRATRRKEAITAAFLYEGIPQAVHVLTATNRLDLALNRMEQTVHNQWLRARLKRLVELIRAPQFATPADAFEFWASEVGVRDIEYFAMATREAVKYSVPLEQLWLDMADLLGKDLEYKRNIRSQTAHHRSGGYVFYGMLAGSFVLGYPFTQKYMGAGTKVAFWIVLGVMTFGLYLIVKKSQQIDV